MAKLTMMSGSETRIVKLIVKFVNYLETLEIFRESIPEFRPWVKDDNGEVKDHNNF